MTPLEIGNIISTYSLRGRATQRPDGGRVYVAWYDELPGCVAEAGDKTAALAELDAVVPFVLERLAKDGIAPPVASGAKEITSTFQLSGVFVGGRMQDLPATTVEQSTTKMSQGVLTRA
jgi:predicted RNase H-like HicB family nuclease